MILLIDFGSQTTHLIGRRIKELGIDCEIINPENSLEVIRNKKPEGIILSGGPADVFEKNAPTVDAEIFEMGIPVLGICYGHQLMGHLLKGEVRTGLKKEFGPATLFITKYSKLLEGLPGSSAVWMNHGNEINKLPKGFIENAKSIQKSFAAISNESKKLYAIQFHPEVVHTEYGQEIFKNFLNICGVDYKKVDVDKNSVDDLIADIKDSIFDKNAICALSGGVDSSVAAVLVHRAIRKNLTSIYIDSGLMREGETDTLREVFAKNFKMNVLIIDAKKEFLRALKGVIDPEEKRKAIGKTFIEVFEKEAKKLNADVLVQGTIYPDVIESKGSKHAQNIKSHHNVGGLPENMKLILVEPLRQFYKDEVRKIGQIINLPESITSRQPFPGPGLAVRIIGEITEEKLDILKKADKIVREEIEKSGWDKKLWQFFAIFAGIKTTGVKGDARFYGETIAIRAIEATDAMSANFSPIPYEILGKISVRIVTEIKEVNRVVYDITNKPPATMEWE